MKGNRGVPMESRKDIFKQGLIRSQRDGKDPDGLHSPSQFLLKPGLVPSQSRGHIGPRTTSGFRVCPDSSIAS